MSTFLTYISSDNRRSLTIASGKHIQNPMSYIILFFLLGFSAIIFAEPSSEIDRVKEHLQRSAQQLSLPEISHPPKPASYLNSKLTKNAPHQINLTNELTKIIPKWSPRILALDPTCPYYFSKLNDPSSSEHGLNLLSYLQAIESNETTTYPFISIFPQSYRSGLPLFSIFHCREYLSPSSDPFFHNIELLIGPGQTEFPLKRQSNQFSQFYCSLYGQPHFLLLNQTKQPTITYDAQTLLAQDDLTEIDFLLTSLAVGTCLFVPSDWVIGIQLNNSISFVLTLKKLPTEGDDEFFPCTKTSPSTFETIPFAFQDTFNMSTIGLIIYFYQYLNPPIFDQEYTSQTFLQHFQEDKNISKLIMKWTPELLNIIEKKLFQELDINQDDKFNIVDYFDIKQSNIEQLQKSIYEILEEIRRNVLAQYTELNEMMKQILHQSGNHGLDDDAKESVKLMIENLPEAIKEKLKENNINVKEVLNKLQRQKSKSSSSNKQHGKKHEQAHRPDL